MTTRSERTNQPLRKVIFLDFAASKFETVMRSLKRDNVAGEASTEPERFLERLALESFDVCVVNLLVGSGPQRMIANIRSRSRNEAIKIIVITKQVRKENLQKSLQAGADDFIADPFENESLYRRILYQFVPKTTLEPEGYERTLNAAKMNQDYHEVFNFIEVLLSSTESLSRCDREEMHEIFQASLVRIAGLLQSNRTSLVVVDAEREHGVVLASSDDLKFKNYSVSLRNYPEILDVLRTGNFLLIEDVLSNTLTKEIPGKVKSIRIGSLMVFPIRYRKAVVGVLFVRRATANTLPSTEILRILQAFANTLAVHTNIEVLFRRIYQEQNRRLVDFRKVA